MSRRASNLKLESKFWEIEIYKMQALYSTNAVFNDEAMSHLSKHNMQALINELTNLEESDMKRRALSFISDYSLKDVFLINLTLDSLRNWDISLPGKKQLVEELQSSKVSRNIEHMS